MNINLKNNNKRVKTNSDIGDSIRKKNETNFTKRNVNAENISNKESKNQTTLEQYRLVHFDSNSLGKIKKKLTKKSSRGISKKNDDIQNNQINNKFFENNLTLKEKKTSKILKSHKNKNYNKKNEIKLKKGNEYMFNKKRNSNKNLSESKKINGFTTQNKFIKEIKQSK